MNPLSETFYYLGSALMYGAGLLALGYVFFSSH